MLEHVARVKSYLTAYRCMRCGQRYQTASALMDHLPEHSDFDDEEEPPEVITIDDSDSEVTSDTDLVDLADDHRSGDTAPRSVCNEEVARPQPEPQLGPTPLQPGGHLPCLVSPAPPQPGGPSPCPVGPAPLQLAGLSPCPVGPAPLQPGSLSPSPVGPAPLQPGGTSPCPAGPAPLQLAGLSPCPVGPAPHQRLIGTVTHQLNGPVSRSIPVLLQLAGPLPCSGGPVTLQLTDPSARSSDQLTGPPPTWPNCPAVEPSFISMDTSPWEPSPPPPQVVQSPCTSPYQADHAPRSGVSPAPVSLAPLGTENMPNKNSPSAKADVVTGVPKRRNSAAPFSSSVKSRGLRAVNRKKTSAVSSANPPAAHPLRPKPVVLNRNTFVSFLKSSQLPPTGSSECASKTEEINTSDAITSTSCDDIGQQLPQPLDRVDLPVQEQPPVQVHPSVQEQPLVQEQHPVQEQPPVQVQPPVQEQPPVPPHPDSSQNGTLPDRKELPVDGIAPALPPPRAAKRSGLRPGPASKKFPKPRGSGAVPSDRLELPVQPFPTKGELKEIPTPLPESQENGDALVRGQVQAQEAPAPTPNSAAEWKEAPPMNGAAPVSEENPVQNIAPPQPRRRAAKRPARRRAGSRPRPASKRRRITSAVAAPTTPPSLEDVSQAIEQVTESNLEQTIQLVMAEVLDINIEEPLDHCLEQPLAPAVGATSPQPAVPVCVATTVQRRGRGRPPGQQTKPGRGRGLSGARRKRSVATMPARPPPLRDLAAAALPPLREVRRNVRPQPASQESPPSEDKKPTWIELVIEEKTRRLEGSLRGCNLCEYKSRSLSFHVLSHLKRHPTKTCLICGETFQNKLLLKDHKSMEHTILVFQCHDCSSRFETKFGLRKHIEQAHLKF